VPIALRTMESTTEIFTKLVTINSTKGARPSAAKAIINTSGRLETLSEFKLSDPPMSSRLGAANAAADITIEAALNVNIIMR
jgi:hypothetical protein